MRFNQKPEEDAASAEITFSEGDRENRSSQLSDQWEQLEKEEDERWIPSGGAGR